MECTRCSTEYSLDDNYCRRCGAPLRAQRLPVPLPQRSLARPQGLPVAPLLLRSMSAILLGKAVEWALRKALQQVASLLAPDRLPAPPAARRPRALAGAEAEAFSVRSETKVFWQRVWYVRPPVGEPAPSRKRLLFWRK